ncbi:MAG: ion channel [Sphingorhabdus sp.]|uniref:ion channel n=1 Tax=Sphingorhabdus sp. TaxID=1902408 RepID=UPI0038FCA0A9
MFVQLFVSTFSVLLTVVIHGVGLALLGRSLRNEIQVERAHHLAAMSARAMLFTLALVIGLFTLHGIEIWLYAFLFEAIGAVTDIETAVYFSTISYAGIGFDDRYINPDWRLVAAIEGINGLLLLGWSTAFFVTIVARLGRT